MSKQKLNKIAGLYYRLSKDDERAGESLPIENQKRICEKIANENGFDTNPWLKALTERAEFFASYKASGADNTLCIIKPDNEVWREKGKRELKILIRG